MSIYQSVVKIDENAMRHTPEGQAFTELVLAVFRANGALIAAGDALVGDLGLSSARWQVLGMVVDQARTVPAIARKVGLTRQGVQRTADWLVRDGLARFCPNPDHATSHLLDLTERGQAIMAEVTRRQIAWADRAAQGLKAESLAAFAATLQEVCKQIQPGRARR